MVRKRLLNKLPIHHSIFIYSFKRDSAGQERFNAITSSYYRGAHGVILLYDVTDYSSFQNVSKWLRNIDEVINLNNILSLMFTHINSDLFFLKYAQENVSILLVGNKVDRFDSIAIRTEQGKELAKKHNIDFIETSAKQNVNIKEAVNFFVTKIVEKVRESYYSFITAIYD